MKRARGAASSSSPAASRSLLPPGLANATPASTSAPLLTGMLAVVNAELVAKRARAEGRRLSPLVRGMKPSDYARIALHPGIFDRIGRHRIARVLEGMRFGALDTGASCTGDAR